MSKDLVIWKKDPEDAFVTLTMNRPDKMNAWTLRLGAEGRWGRRAGFQGRRRLP